jgi:galactose mutarotase-like enzyme/CheY-like chemotaxis protein
MRLGSLKENCLFRSLALLLIISLSLPPQAMAQALNLPAPGTMVTVSDAFTPVMMKGLKVHPENPLQFDFLIDSGHSGMALQSDAFKAESDRLIRYFLASLTIPEKDLWVNLSPYEHDRMINAELGKTGLGRDMLAQDYILKQLTASLVYPEKELGKKFWDNVYTQAQAKFGTTDIPVDTFNKVWIKADKARVLERNGTAYVVGAHLKVMIESDYLAESMEHGAKSQQQNKINANPEKNSNNSLHPSMLSAPSSMLPAPGSMLARQILKSIIIPAIEEEVNTGANFAPLRQMFYAMILSTWYKATIKDALLNQVYADKALTDGVNLNDPAAKEKIYAQYLEAYTKGVFNYIKEDATATGDLPRKYFSGGVATDISAVLSIDHAARAGDDLTPGGDMAQVTASMARTDADMAQNPEATAQRARTLFQSIAASVLLGKNSLFKANKTKLLAFLHQLMKYPAAQALLNDLKNAETVVFQTNFSHFNDLFTQLVTEASADPAMSPRNAKWASLTRDMETISRGSRYKATWLLKEGHELIRFSLANDNETSFTIKVDRGFRVVSWKIKGKERLLVHEDLSVLGGGIFTMFPLVNRTKKGKFNRTGQPFDINDLEGLTYDGKTGNPIHGIARVADQWKDFMVGEDSEGVFIRASFDTADYPGLAEKTGRSKLTKTFHFSKNDLITDDVVEGSAGAIADAGEHPFLRYTPGKTTLHAPGITGVFPVDPEKIPAGDPTDLPEEKDFRTARPLTGALDNTFTATADANGLVTVTVADSGTQTNTTFELSGMFSAPAGETAVVHLWGGNPDPASPFHGIGAVEGVTVTANGANRQGETGGTKLFAEGEVRRGRVRMTVSDANTKLQTPVPGFTAQDAVLARKFGLEGDALTSLAALNEQGLDARMLLHFADFSLGKTVSTTYLFEDIKGLTRAASAFGEVLQRSSREPAGTDKITLTVKYQHPQSTYLAVTPSELLGLLNTAFQENSRAVNSFFAQSIVLIQADGVHAFHAKGFAFPVSSSAGTRSNTVLTPDGLASIQGSGRGSRWRLSVNGRDLGLQLSGEDAAAYADGILLVTNRKSSEKPVVMFQINGNALKEVPWDQAAPFARGTPMGAESIYRSATVTNGQLSLKHEISRLGPKDFTFNLSALAQSLPPPTTDAAMTGTNQLKLPANDQDLIARLQLTQPAVDSLYYLQTQGIAPHMLLNLANYASGKAFSITGSMTGNLGLLDQLFPDIEQHRQQPKDMEWPADRITLTVATGMYPTVIQLTPDEFLRLLEAIARKFAQPVKDFFKNTIHLTEKDINHFVHLKGNSFSLRHLARNRYDAVLNKDGLYILKASGTKDNWALAVNGTDLNLRLADDDVLVFSHGILILTKKGAPDDPLAFFSLNKGRAHRISPEKPVHTGNFMGLKSKFHDTSVTPEGRWTLTHYTDHPSLTDHFSVHIPNLAPEIPMDMDPAMTARTIIPGLTTQDEALAEKLGLNEPARQTLLRLAQHGLDSRAAVRFMHFALGRIVHDKTLLRLIGGTDFLGGIPRPLERYGRVVFQAQYANDPIPNDRIVLAASYDINRSLRLYMTPADFLRLLETSLPIDQNAVSAFFYQTTFIDTADEITQKLELQDFAYPAGSPANTQTPKIVLTPTDLATIQSRKKGYRSWEILVNGQLLDQELTANDVLAYISGFLIITQINSSPNVIIYSLDGNTPLRVADEQVTPHVTRDPLTPQSKPQGLQVFDGKIFLSHYISAETDIRTTKIDVSPLVNAARARRLIAEYQLPSLGESKAGPITANIAGKALPTAADSTITAWTGRISNLTDGALIKIQDASSLVSQNYSIDPTGQVTEAHNMFQALDPQGDNIPDQVRLALDLFNHPDEPLILVQHNNEYYIIRSNGDMLQLRYYPPAEPTFLVTDIRRLEDHPVLREVQLLKDFTASAAHDAAMNLTQPLTTWTKTTQLETTLTAANGDQTAIWSEGNTIYLGGKNTLITISPDDIIAAYGPLLIILRQQDGTRYDLQITFFHSNQEIKVLDSHHLNLALTGERFTRSYVDLRNQDLNDNGILVLNSLQGLSLSALARSIMARTRFDTAGDVLGLHDIPEQDVPQGVTAVETAGMVAELPDAEATREVRAQNPTAQLAQTVNPGGLIAAVTAGADVLISSEVLGAEEIQAARQEAERLGKGVVVISGVNTTAEDPFNQIIAAEANGADAVKLKPAGKGNEAATARMIERAHREYFDLLILAAGGVNRENRGRFSAKAAMGPDSVADIRTIATWARTSSFDAAMTREEIARQALAPLHLPGIGEERAASSNPDFNILLSSGTLRHLLQGKDLITLLIKYTPRTDYAFGKPQPEEQTRAVSFASDGKILSDSGVLEGDADTQALTIHYLERMLAEHQDEQFMIFTFGEITAVFTTDMSFVLLISGDSITFEYTLNAHEMFTAWMADLSPELQRFRENVERITVSSGSDRIRRFLGPNPQDNAQTPAQNDPQAKASAFKTTASVQEHLRRQDRRVILFVEDHPMILKGILRKLGQYDLEVLSADNDADARKIIQERPDISLVITDNNFPPKPDHSGAYPPDNGIALAGHVFETFGGRVPVIIQSSNKVKSFDGIVWEKDNLSTELTALFQEWAKTEPDAAMANPPGGIDLNARDMGLDVDKDGTPVNMTFDPALIEQFRSGDFSGVTPVIIQIIPIAGPMAVLGLETRDKDLLAKG